MTRDDPELARVVGALRVTHDIEQAGAVELRLYGHRPEVKLNAGGKPRRTGRELDPYVALHQPLGGPMATGDPGRLRRLARLIDDYADGLEALLNPPAPADGVQLDLLTETQEPSPCPTPTASASA